MAEREALRMDPARGAVLHAPGPKPALLSGTVIPAMLMLVTPSVAVFVWFTHTRFGGSLERLAEWIGSAGLAAALVQVWRPVIFGSPVAWTMIAIFATIQLALMRVLPGKASQGSVTPAGNVPVYRANGIAAFLATLALFLGASFGLGLFSPTIIYDHFGELLGALNLAGILLCIALYLKGRYAPSSSDHGLSRNLVFDFYWGTELHPRILGWDIKMFVTCRFGMMAWPLILVSFVVQQVKVAGFLSDAMAVAVALQLLYVGKFFWWETGYLRSLDITHDRAGFYICWGCLVWLPSIYTGSTLYLVGHPNRLGTPVTILLLLLGSGAILINYLADAQRQKVRQADGAVKIWGKPPVLIRAHYRTTLGDTKSNILLASGWWGLARHFHYVPELVAAFCWTLPVLFDHALPYFYPISLVVLLLHRAWRDDARCAAKYGASWDAYCSRVPYRLVPRLI